MVFLGFRRGGGRETDDDDYLACPRLSPPVEIIGFLSFFNGFLWFPPGGGRETDDDDYHLACPRLVLGVVSTTCLRISRGRPDTSGFWLVLLEFDLS